MTMINFYASLILTIDFGKLDFLLQPEEQQIVNLNRERVAKQNLQKEEKPISKLNVSSSICKLVYPAKSKFD